MNTYDITPPKNAPQAALDKLGEPTGKTLEEMRAFVLSLHPQMSFQKAVAHASEKGLIDYLAQNGYVVETHEPQA